MGYGPSVSGKDICFLISSMVLKGSTLAACGNL